VIDDYFVCIGAQKAGTTWLARVLQHHPELFLTPVKEIHYFDHVYGVTDHLSRRRRRSRYRKYHQKLWTQWTRFHEARAEWPWYRDYMRDPLDDAWYARLFSHRGGKRFAGEVTPEYALLDEAGFAHMRRLAPKARVLFIVRNPLEQAWSGALHHARAAGMSPERLSPEALIAILEQPRQRALADYRTTIERLGRAFPREQVSTLVYDEIHADRRAAVARICDFIGISDATERLPELGQRFNVSRETAMPDPVREHLTPRARATAGAVCDYLGRLPAGWPAP
jgi:hypothetical protein